ncbi:T-cell leukemia translocation-altered gene protein isoform X1 [Peromyscus leucopus]|uniref:T-cell leukemia translocation-altered gene protein isoform X1 n=1 Tax=Peromyscus leucopus TaxID=10041 RepID=UPI0010A1731C|nr:T-cell leukemia translocation-altered gene protein isoform X1 [Peromyscus leucopus]
MAEPWSGQFLQALPAMVLGALGTLGSEFLREWETQDMRVTLFKLLLLWLVLSLLGIQLAWGFYGNTVTGLYHRPGKWQQMNLSKPTENKGRQQQKGLQRHHWVCWLLCCILLLPRPPWTTAGAWGWGTGVPQCFQGDPPLPPALLPTVPGTGQVKFVSTLVCCPETSVKGQS